MDIRQLVWNNDECKRLIHNEPSCPIPLMSVDEGEDDEFTAFLAGGPDSESSTIQVDQWNNDSSDVAQQTTKDGLLLPPDHLVRHYAKKQNAIMRDHKQLRGG